MPDYKSAVAEMCSKTKVTQQTQHRELRQVHHVDRYLASRSNGTEKLTRSTDTTSYHFFAEAALLFTSPIYLTIWVYQLKG